MLMMTGLPSTKIFVQIRSIPHRCISTYDNLLWVGRGGVRVAAAMNKGGRDLQKGAALYLALCLVRVCCYRRSQGHQRWARTKGSRVTMTRTAPKMSSGKRRHESRTRASNPQVFICAHARARTHTHTHTRNSIPAIQIYCNPSPPRKRPPPPVPLCLPPI